MQLLLTQQASMGQVRQEWDVNPFPSKQYIETALTAHDKCSPDAWENTSTVVRGEATSPLTLAALASGRGTAIGLNSGKSMAVS